MGACNLEFTLPVKDNTKADVQARFEDFREEGLYEHGHDPYNGTWSTIPSLKFIDITFPNVDKAIDYCLENAEKWEYAIVVKAKDKKGELVWVASGWAAE